MPETKVKEKVLKIADRCDRCGAQAFIIATGVSGDLYFCGHHYHKYEYAITQWAYKIVNELDTINAKSASSPI
jgi:ribosomal protein L37E